MKIIVAPDSFKGSLTAFEAADAIQYSVCQQMPWATIVKLPIADGGEGTVDILSAVIKGEVIYKPVPGPYGKQLLAHYFIAEDKTAYIELAQASGLIVTALEERDPLYASTYGTGLLIADALDHAIEKICLTLGGSATNDGGAGIAKALGIQIKNTKNEVIAPNCAGLADAATIDITTMDPRLLNLKIEIACDVDNPLCGPNGASYIYGPQKGATPAIIKQMDAILKRYGQLLEEVSGRDLINKQGTGAAGGAALPLLAFCDVTIISGIQMVLRALSFEEHLAGADAVYTGEGKVDAQTGFGKAIAGIHTLCQSKNIPLFVFAGAIGDVDEALFSDTTFFSINKTGSSLRENMKNAKENLKNAAACVTQKYLLGEKI